MNYENRVVLFLDILGFGSIINKTVNNENNDNTSYIEDLYKILSSMKRELNYRDENNNNRVVTQFSDTIVISFSEDNEDEVFLLFDDIQSLIASLIRKGILVRGAISYGKLIHDKHVIFGPALVDAYETEVKAALYPRVILDKSIVDIGKKNKKFEQNSVLSDEFDGSALRLKKDTDEKYYLDYFISARYLMDDEEFLLEYIPALKKIILNGQNFKKPDLKVKYGWLKNKYNPMVELLNDETKHGQLGIIRELAKKKALRLNVIK